MDVEEGIYDLFHGFHGVDAADAQDVVVKIVVPNWIMIMASRHIPLRIPSHRLTFPAP